MNEVRRVLSTLGMRDGFLVVGFFTANLAIETTSNLLQNTVWLELSWLGCLVLLTVVLAWRITRKVAANELAEFSAATTADSYGARGDAALARRKGAVVILGLDSASTDSAVAKLLRNAGRLEWLALIGTHETRAARVATTVQTRICSLSGHRFDDEHVRAWEHNHALSVRDYAASVQEAIAWMTRKGLRPNEIIVDVTSGRRMAGFGAIQAADDAMVETQYLAYRWDHQAHRPVVSEESFRIISPYWTDMDGNDRVSIPTAA